MKHLSLSPMPGVAALLLGLLSAPAQAAPQVTVNFGFCTHCTLPAFEAVSVSAPLPGRVATPNNPYNLLTFGDGSIELSMDGAFSTGFCCVNPGLYPGHNFNGYKMRFSQAGAITGAQLVAYNTGGLQPELSWTADTIYLNMWGGQVSQSATVLLSFTTAAVPEPAAIVLLGMGLAAVALAARRQRS